MSRPTIAEVDLGAIAHNLAEVRRLVGPKVMICPAVKADAYGHGAVMVSRTLVDLSVDMLGVSSIEEGAELREAGIASPILVLGCPLRNDVKAILELNLTSAVSSQAFAECLQTAASDARVRAKVHIKVDTGMGRLGVRPEDAQSLILAVAGMPNLEIEGIFTHLSCADDPNSTFTDEQMAMFDDVARSAEAQGVKIPIRHAANSGAILNKPLSHLDMVRPGIMLYGLYDAPLPAGVQLRPALTLKSSIVFLKHVPAGATISYGRAFATTRTTLVATVPIGYADGYNRRLSNMGYALVRGRRVPVIGRVCMDQTLFDVTDVPEVQVGDEVVLYGRQGDNEIQAEEVASLLDTISYEVVCCIGKRVPRLYRV